MPKFPAIKIIKEQCSNISKSGIIPIEMNTLCYLANSQNILLKNETVLVCNTAHSSPLKASAISKRNQLPQWCSFLRLRAGLNSKSFCCQESCQDYYTKATQLSKVASRIRFEYIFQSFGFGPSFVY